MTAATVVWIVIGGMALGIILWLVLSYNGLVAVKNRAENAWSQIDVQLKRRHDLIPNLVETAKGYMQHERETLEAVTKARSQASSARQPGDRARAEGALGEALTRFLAVAEQYPDLKANENFLALQEELVSTENRIAFARQAYNDGVLELNNRIEMFPSNVVAGMFHFAKREFFDLPDQAQRAVPKVQF